MNSIPGLHSLKLSLPNQGKHSPSTTPGVNNTVVVEVGIIVSTEILSCILKLKKILEIKSAKTDIVTKYFNLIFLYLSSLKAKLVSMKTMYELTIQVLSVLY